MQDPYSSSPPYPNRNSQAMSMEPPDSRLPPITSGTNQYYNTPQSMGSASHAPAHDRSPIDQYPGQFTYSPQSYYPSGTLPQQGASAPYNHPPGAPLGRRSSMSVDRTVPSRASIHGQVPYARDPHQVGPSYSQSNEPMIKPKRKRATPDQLKVLNQTYERTAFPSTEERIQLAKDLGMSPRSVQIWYVIFFTYLLIVLYTNRDTANFITSSLFYYFRFQNKRQAQRTMNRQQEMGSAPAPIQPPPNPYQSSSLYGAVPASAYQGRPSTAGGHSGSPGYEHSPSPSSHPRGRSPQGDRSVSTRRSTSRPPR